VCLLVVSSWLVVGLTVTGAIWLVGRIDEKRTAAVSPETPHAREVASAAEAPQSGRRAREPEAAGRARESARPPAPTDALQAYSMEGGISYRSASQQKLDLYRPVKQSGDGRTLVFLYDGFSGSSTRQDYRFLGQALASRGITVVVPDYQLSPDVRFPTFIEQSAHAVRWTADNIGADNIFVLGNASGAYVAFMLAANTRYLADAGVDRMKLGGVIGLSGPYDFLSPASPRLQEIFGGPASRATQPIMFANAPLPPALLVHGAADTKVDLVNSERLAAAWLKTGAETVLKVYPGVDQAGVLAAFADEERWRAATRADVVTFIRTH